MKWDELTAKQKREVGMWLVDRAHDMNVDRESLSEEMGFDFVSALVALAEHVSS